MHGVQSLEEEKARIPMSYYAPDSGVGRAMRAVPALFGAGARVGFVGLGAGSLACYAEPDQRWTVFEIDPAVVDLTIGKGAFTYVARCKPDIRVVLGDARLTLAREPKGGLDLLAVDAFSSDSIPLHLLTQEAFAIYLRALAPDGVLLVHVSNRFLALEPVVAAAVEARGLAARRLRYSPSAADARAGMRFSSSDWIAIARDEARMARVVEAAQGSALADAAWAPLAPAGDVQAWRDDHASILPLLKVVRGE
jgi:spermidine synthase